MRALFLVAVIALFSLACAQPDEFAVAKQLVESKTGCDTLSDAQLELIGDYLMEQMHPGVAHERMDAMMGGEGSESLKRVHVQMAQVLYCGRNDTPLTYGGMIGMMPMMAGYGMMGGYYGAGASNAYGPMGRGVGSSGFGMMGSPYSTFGWSVFDVLTILLLAGLTAIVYLHLFQKLRGARHGK